MVKDGEDYLKYYSEVQPSKIHWIWYPYIAEGKITLLQGDPGDGKSTMVLHLIAELSKGGCLPDGTEVKEPILSMYQCSEDNAADTIRPRLDESGANCDNVAFIDEEVSGNLTLDDELIRESIVRVKPKLVVIDPLQSYLGPENNILIVGRARSLMHKLSVWASTYNCAIILISHLTKNESTKDLYRGLGSIDVVAAARSVLQVETDAENPDIKRVKQIKNNIAPKGTDFYYEMNHERGFRWVDINRNENVEEPVQERPITKTAAAVLLVEERLKNGMVPTNTIVEALTSMGLSDRVIRDAKKELGIKSVRKGGQWHWSLPDIETQESSIDKNGK